jgi:hypothetical protein
VFSLSAAVKREVEEPEEAPDSDIDREEPPQPPPEPPETEQPPPGEVADSFRGIGYPNTVALINRMGEHSVGVVYCPECAMEWVDAKNTHSCPVCGSDKVRGSKKSVEERVSEAFQQVGRGVPYDNAIHMLFGERTRMVSEEETAAKKKWTGTLGEFNSKLQAVIDKTSVLAGIGEVTSALQAANAISSSGGKIDVDLPAMRRVLLKLNAPTEAAPAPAPEPEPARTEPAEMPPPPDDMPPPESPIDDMPPPDRPADVPPPQEAPVSGDVKVGGGDDDAVEAVIDQAIELFFA